MQGHLATSVVERKALSLASEQIAARNELQGKKKTNMSTANQRGDVCVNFRGLDLYSKDWLISVKISKQIVLITPISTIMVITLAQQCDLPLHCNVAAFWYMCIASRKG